MESKPLRTLLKVFPGSRYYAAARLFTWHPQGVLDDALADEIVGVIESEEFFQDSPFNRYTDLSGLTSIRLKVGHIFQIAEHRREASHPAKSAFFADTIVGFGIARMYESLMERAAIQVRAFRDRAAAAEWLEVDLKILHPH
jgi:hypothetical protein